MTNSSDVVNFVFMLVCFQGFALRTDLRIEPYRHEDNVNKNKIMIISKENQIMHFCVF